MDEVHTRDTLRDRVLHLHINPIVPISCWVSLSGWP
jgi:hypothetical protein